MVSGFGSSDTSPGGRLSPWDASHGQLWAAPLTWPAGLPCSLREQSPLKPGTPRTQDLLWNHWNREPRAAADSIPCTQLQKSL